VTRSLLRLVLAVSALAVVNPAAAALPPGFADSPVTSVGSPTAIAFTPDGRMLITTQPGTLRVYAGGSLLTTPALDIRSRVCSVSEQGLLGVAVDPAFAANRFIYLYYTAATPGCVNRVSRFTLSDANTVDPATELILIDRIPGPGGNHNGGDLHFGKDGNLYVSVGDGGCDYANDSGCQGANDAARDLHALVGKILRITPAGAIPPGNPYQGADSARCNATGTTTPGLRCQEIFATGLRNPFRIAFDPNATGTRFFINDVGNAAWEEVDEGAVGADYGWNMREGPCVRNGVGPTCGPPAPPGLTDPVYAYGRSGGCVTITGGAFVPVGLWPSEYDGAYLFSDFGCGKIFALQPNGTGGYAATEFATGLGSGSAVAMAFGPSGSTRALYYTSYAGGGQVRRIEHTGSPNRAPTPSIAASPACACGPAPLGVTFDASGSSDLDGDALSYEWDLDGDGAYGDSTAVSPSRVYPVGTHVVRLRVSDGRGGAAIAAATVTAQNTAPTATIVSPADSRFRAGETVTLTATATDAQDGALPPARLSWRVVRHHGSLHTHEWLPPTVGNDVRFQAPGPEDLATARTSFLEVELTATDSNGAATTVRRRLDPRIVELRFATRPAGLRVSVAGELTAGGRPVASWEGWPLRLAAPWQRDARGRPWTFASWSDGGARAHTVTTTAPRTYTARFVPAVQIAAIRPRAGEWVRLRNVGGRPVVLTRWTLADADGNRLRLGRVIVGAGRTVIVRTSGMWDEGGDRATLRVPSGAVVDRCSYARGGGSTKRC
jgi:glucose/arabinose dehydrogenase